MKLIVVVAVVSVAALLAKFLQRRKPQAPTQPKMEVPAQVDRNDFPQPEVQWLVAVFSSASCATCIDVVAKSQALATSLPSWINFGKASIRSIDIVQDILGRLSKEKKIGAYGAAGKATMWLNACKLDFVEFVVDASPLRYGKFMPGVHSPIISPDEFKKNYPDLVLVTAWNYLEQIKKNETNYGGIWCSPLPTLNFS